MKRQNAEDITSLLRQFIRREGLETPLNEFRLVEAWPSVVGKQIGGMTESVSIRNQVLYVKLRSAALRNELVMRRSDLVRRLNETVGANVITGIVFN